MQADGSKPQNLSDFSVSMTPDEIRNFVLMSQSGLSFRQAAVISFRNADEIFDLLKQGIPLEKVFTYNQKKKFFRQLGELLNFLELPKALERVVILEKGSSHLLHLLSSQLSYPMFLMFFAWLLLWFFTPKILPSLSMYAADSEFILLYILLGLFTVFWFGLIVLGLLFLVSKKQSSGMISKKASQILQRLFRKFSLIRKIQSYSLCAWLECLLSCGLSTRETIENLKKMKSTGFICVEAREWNRKMRIGYRFEEILKDCEWIDPIFLTFLEVGMESSQVVSLLNSYRKQTLIQIEKELKQFSVYIQCLAYGSVGMLCISVYQVMLAPLNMLSTF